MWHHRITLKGGQLCTFRSTYKQSIDLSKDIQTFESFSQDGSSVYDIEVVTKEILYMTQRQSDD